MKRGSRIPLLIDSWQGLGDTIYLRPGVQALASRDEVYVGTSWPELLEDLDVKFVRPRTDLRTQLGNVRRQHPHRWSERPQRAQPVEPKVLWSRPVSIPQSMAFSLGLDPSELEFRLPSFPRPAGAPEGPYAVVRPVTVRSEWEAPARNPDPRYVAAAAAAVSERGLAVVSVAHLEDGEEWAIEPMPPADVALHRGELGVRALMGLVEHAEVVIGGVGWIVPAGAALATPTVIIGGGWGFYNAPERVVGPPMDGRRIRFILPDAYCRWCHDQHHDCPKEIDGFAWRLDAALDEIGIASPLTSQEQRG